jgi:hypothetical protein
LTAYAQIASGTGSPRILHFKKYTRLFSGERLKPVALDRAAEEEADRQEADELNRRDALKKQKQLNLSTVTHTVQLARSVERTIFRAQMGAVHYRDCRRNCESRRLRLIRD